MGNVGYTGERYGKGYYNGKREREMGKTAFLRLGTGVVAVVLVCGCAAMGLSLIHISEPTRPY